MTRREFGAAPLALSAMQAEAQSKPAPRILAVSAHPADFCSRAGGTLIRHIHAGSKAKVIWLTHGESDESQLLYKQRPGISVEEVRRIREKEAFDAATIIGIEEKMFGWGDGPLRMTPERMEMLAREMRISSPT